NRGRSVTLWQGMWYIAASCTGLIILPFYFLDFGETLWRIAVGFGAVPALVILLLRYMLMDESPIWAASNEGLPAAGRILEKTYGIRVTVSVPASAQRAPAAAPNFSEIFTPKYRMRTILASIICLTQSLEYFAVGFNLPSISVKLFGSDFLYAILGAIFFNIFGIVGGFGGAFLTERIGVRRLAMIGYALVIISLLALWSGGERMPLIATAALLGLFVFGHSFGPGSQGMTMAALSFPTRIRGIGTGWGQAMVRVGSILGFYFFPIVVAAAGLRSMLLYLALVPLLGLIGALAIAWEPADHDVEDLASSGDTYLGAAPAIASMQDR
ncbi:MAG: MFS transporter, partial [Acetobacteraceae bacterium]